MLISYFFLKISNASFVFQCDMKNKNVTYFISFISHVEHRVIFALTSEIAKRTLFHTNALQAIFYIVDPI